MRDQGTGQEEPGAQQGLGTAQTGHTGVELLPHLTHPQHRALHVALRGPQPGPHLETGRETDMETER